MFVRQFPQIFKQRRKINEIGSTWYNAVLAKKYFAVVCKQSSEMLILFNRITC